MTTKAMFVWRARRHGEDPEQAAADWDRAAREGYLRENGLAECCVCGKEHDEKLSHCSEACRLDDEGAVARAAARAAGACIGHRDNCGCATCETARDRAARTGCPACDSLPPGRRRAAHVLCHPTPVQRERERFAELLRSPESGPGLTIGSTP